MSIRELLKSELTYLLISGSISVVDGMASAVPGTDWFDPNRRRYITRIDTHFCFGSNCNCRGRP